MIASAAPPAGGRGIIVEFVGLSGSGKSTVSHAIAAVLRDAGRPVTERSFEIAHRMGAVARRLAKLRLAGRTLLLRPGPSLALAIRVARTCQRRWIEGIVKTLDLFYVCGLIAELSRRPGIHLLDQGFFGGLWSIGFGAGSAPALGPLIEIGSRCCGGPPAGAVFLLEVPPATAVERLKRRPGAASRLERRLATATWEQDLGAAIASLHQVRGAIEGGAKPWRVRVVREHETAPAAALAAEIAGLGGGWPRGGGGVAGHEIGR